MNPGVHVRVAHLSDPHFGTIVPAVRDALLADLLSQPPDLILVTGDITQRARREQFVQAREFFNALPPVPRLCLPGNHDLPLFDVLARAINPYEHYRWYIGKDLEPTYVDDRIAVLCIDATSRLRHKDGALRAEQIERVAADLAQMNRP
ncbi:MAG: metallophosphoesterase, partial [Steroidobacteraceae bacterium]